MSLAACYVLHLECDREGCRNEYDSDGDAQTYTQARRVARRCGWRLPRQHWGHDQHNPVLCPEHAHVPPTEEEVLTADPFTPALFALPGGRED